MPEYLAGFVRCVGVPILLLLLVATIVEITVLILVGQAIGILATIGLLILASVVGMWLLRREGNRTLTAFQEAVRTRRVPHREMADGVLIVAAGALILVPGFVSDVLALFLLFPPTRSIVSKRFAKRAEQQVRSAQHGGAFVVDSVVVDDDFPEPRGQIEPR
jgi:UPF0716 protein FxsA